MNEIYVFFAKKLGIEAILFPSDSLMLALRHCWFGTTPLFLFCLVIRRCSKVFEGHGPRFNLCEFSRENEHHHF
jgi:hypothetical protein